MKSDHLLLLAQGIAEQTSDFFQRKGPGVGDHATGAFVRALSQLAKEVFGADHSEKVVCKGAGFRFDFFFPDEGTAVEFAFGLHNPNSEFERDILKCILAIEGRVSSKEAHPGRQALCHCATKRSGTEGNCGTCRKAV